LPVPAAAGACFAGLLIAAIPRAGWLALMLTMATSPILNSHDAGALVLVAGALIPAVLTPQDGTVWPLAIVAPALGAVGVACAWPALAAGAVGTHRRAALAATGWLWLALAHRTTAAAIRSSSMDTAVHHVLGPLLTAGVLAPALVWAVAAIAFRFVRIRRSGGLDAALAAGWATALGLATIAAAGLGGGHALLSTGAALPGAYAGALVAIVARRSAARLRSRKMRTHGRYSRSMESR
jgi:hypothetical protein